MCQHDVAIVPPVAAPDLACTFCFPQLQLGFKKNETLQHRRRRRLEVVGSAGFVLIGTQLGLVCGLFSFSSFPTCHSVSRLHQKSGPCSLPCLTLRLLLGTQGLQRPLLGFELLYETLQSVRANRLSLLFPSHFRK